MSATSTTSMTSTPSTPIAPPRFRPLLYPARLATWGLFALALIVAPLALRGDLWLSMLSQMGYVIVICLSYNVLLGQGGMLSFGHAVYTGLGSFIAIHTMNLSAQAGGFSVPVVLIPLVGGLGGLFFAALLGAVTTRRAGITFAMITLGIGELVASMALMFSGFFGGEGGITTDRSYGHPLFGLTFGPQIQVYYLIAVYCFICTALMYGFTATPLGRMLNAVRDNPERAEFIGYDTQRVRYLAFMVAGFFAGVGGGLATINFEIVTAADSMSTVRSGTYLLFTFLGGATHFYGPIIGAVLLVLASVLLSSLTKAWLLYLGLAFLFMVMYAPGGIASLVVVNARVARHGGLGKVIWMYLGMTLAGLVALAGVSAMIEMVYHQQLDSATGPTLRFVGMTLNAQSSVYWVASVVVALVGWGAFEAMRRHFRRRWEAIHEDIERIQREQGATA